MKPQREPALSVRQLRILHVESMFGKFREGFLPACISSILRFYNTKSLHSLSFKLSNKLSLVHDETSKKAEQRNSVKHAT